MNLRHVFLGSQGLRSGWGILLFLAIAGAIGGTIAWVARVTMGPIHHAMRGDIPLPRMLAQELIGCLVVLAATLVMSRIEGRPAAAYGFAPQHALRHAGAGFLCGVACLAVLVLSLVGGGYVALSANLHAAPQALAFGLAWLLVFALVGFSEEAMFRGYLLATLARGIGFWPAAVVLGLLFGAAHAGNPGETPIGLAQVVTAAITFTLLLRLTGSLWASIGFHTGWDWTQSFVLGIPDSGLMMQGHLLTASVAGPAWIGGGPTGPEGSVLALPAFALGGALALLLLWRPRPLAAPG